jgi:hypothetical protein
MFYNNSYSALHVTRDLRHMPVGPTQDHYHKITTIAYGRNLSNISCMPQGGCILDKTLRCLLSPACRKYTERLLDGATVSPLTGDAARNEVHSAAGTGCPRDPNT